jgi:hypothetical protein
MTREHSTSGPKAVAATDRWYLPLVIAAAVVLALLVAAIAALEVAAARSASVAPASAWPAALAEMDAAIARGDLAVAAARWRDAHTQARRSGHWQALLDLGDGSRRFGRAAGGARFADAYARDAYLHALLRARHEESLDGVLRAAEAFAELGDRDVVEHALAMGRALAARDGDPHALAQVKRFSDRWAARTLGVERSRAAR